MADEPIVDPAPEPSPDPEPAPDPAPEPDPKSALEDPGEPGPIAAPVDFPEDWAMKFTEGDEKQANFIKSKHTSPVAYIKSLQGEHAKLRSKLSKGEGIGAFPNDGTDDEKTAWRSEKDIPAESKAYLEDYSIGEDIKFTEEEHPFIDSYLEHAHQANTSKGEVKDTLKWYHAQQQKEVAELQAQDEVDKVETRDDLRDEMGADYTRFMGAAMSLLDTAPEGVKEAFLGSRTPDSRALGNNASVLRWLTQTAMELNPAATVVPGGGSDSMATIDQEIKEIEKRQSEDRRGYFKDQAMQDRYAELLEAKEKIEKKNAA